MAFSNKKLPIILGAAIAVTAIAASSIIYFATTYTSLTAAMVEIMDEDTAEAEETVEGTEEPDEPDEPNVPIPTNTNSIDIDLYLKLLSLKWDKIPDDLAMTDFQWNPPPFSSIGWNAKSYLYAYMLATEICLREEINPPESEVIIRPETLLSKWLSEDANSCIPKGTYCMWDGRDQNTSACIGPYAMNGQYYTLESTNTGHGCIYISRLENPDLDENKRVVIGKPSEIRQGQGRYVTASLYTEAYTDLPQCPLADLKSSMKQGTIATGVTRAINDRPAVTYLPDAMYMTALSVRLGIEGQTLDQIENGGCSYPYLKQLKSLLNAVPGNNLRIASDCIVAGSYNQFAGDSFCRGWDYASDYDIVNGYGIYYLICRNLIKNERSPIVVVNPGETNDTNITTAINRFGSGSGYFAWYVLTGCSDGTYIYTFADELYNIATSTGNSGYEHITAELHKKFTNYSSTHSFILNGLVVSENPDAYIQSIYQANGTDTHKIVDLQYGTLQAYQGYPTTGLSIVNGGGIYERVCTDQVNYAFSLYGDNTTYMNLRRKFGLSSDAITGTDCLGAGCLHNYAERTIVCTSYSQMDTSKYKADTVPLAVAKGVLASNNSKEVVYTLGEKTDTGYNNKFSHISNPIHISCNYAESYDGHAGLDINGLSIGTEVYAADEGVIVSVFSYPFDVGAAREQAGETDYKFSGGNWTRMGGYGNSVVTLHRDKKGDYYFVMYAHLNSFAHIQVGALVDKNTLLGYAGSTGKSTGTHLHFELRPASSEYMRYYESLAYDENCRPGNYTSNLYIKKALNGEFDD